MLENLKLHIKMIGFNSFRVKNGKLIPLLIVRCEFCQTEMVLDEGNPIKYLRTDMKELGQRINKRFVSENEFEDLEFASFFNDDLCDKCFSSGEYCSDV